VTSLPAFGGTINGRILEADGVTPASSVNAFGGTEANVRLRSQVIYFGRTYRTSATSTGAFTFGPNITVPIAPFTVDADHARTQVLSAPTSANFTNGTIANADVVFSNTGMVRGFARRSTGAVVSGAIITAASPFTVTFPQSGTDGSFTVTGLTPGIVPITAAIPHPPICHSPPRDR
jgi:hypothetical protein